MVYLNPFHVTSRTCNAKHLRPARGIGAVRFHRRGGRTRNLAVPRRNSSPGPSHRSNVRSDRIDWLVLRDHPSMMRMGGHMGDPHPPRTTSSTPSIASRRRIRRPSTTTFRRIPEKSAAVNSRPAGPSLCTTQIDIRGASPRVTLSALGGKQSGRTMATKGRIGFDTIKWRHGMDVI